jgi:hypothetical protein
LRWAVLCFEEIKVLDATAIKHDLAITELSPEYENIEIIINNECMFIIFKPQDCLLIYVI